MLITFWNKNPQPSEKDFVVKNFEASKVGKGLFGIFDAKKNGVKLKDNQRWGIFHVGSGLIVQCGKRKNDAVKTIKELEAVGDWYPYPFTDTLFSVLKSREVARVWLVVFRRAYFLKSAAEYSFMLEDED